MNSLPKQRKGRQKKDNKMMTAESSNEKKTQRQTAAPAKRNTFPASARILTGGPGSVGTVVCSTSSNNCKKRRKKKKKGQKGKKKKKKHTSCTCNEKVHRLHTAQRCVPHTSLRLLKLAAP